jgi:hypothetical protein
MDYAKQKPLNGPSELRNGNWAGSLACLSIRFALEFNMDETARSPFLGLNRFSLRRRMNSWRALGQMRCAIWQGTRICTVSIVGGVENWLRPY